MPSERDCTDSAIDLAREGLYRFLAAVLRGPQGQSWPLVAAEANRRLACEAADLLRAEAEAAPVPLGFGELPAEHLDLRPLLGGLATEDDDFPAAYAQAFGVAGPSDCPPYETEYQPNSEPFFRSQQMADIAGFYRAFGLQPARGEPERPDHIALELEFLAFVLMKQRLARAAGGHEARRSPAPEAVEQAAVCAEAARHFFRDHLAWWVPSFATGLRRKAGDGFWAAVGEVLAALLPAERARFDVKAPRLPLRPSINERPEESAACGGCAGVGD